MNCFISRYQAMRNRLQVSEYRMDNFLVASQLNFYVWHYIEDRIYTTWMKNKIELIQKLGTARTSTIFKLKSVTNMLRVICPAQYLAMNVLQIK